MAAPVSGGLVIAEEGATITSVTGATSPVIQITDSPIADGVTITIDLSLLRYCFKSNSLADTNIAVQSTAASPVVWTPSIDPSGDFVTLTSSGGPTAAGDNITVTFKGTATEPWIASSGDFSFPVTVTRTDTGETAEFTFAINTPEVKKGLSITDGAVITTTDGTTSPVITILDAPIKKDGTITIKVENLGVFVASNILMDANVKVKSSAVSPVVWTRSVSPDGKTLTLTSTGGATAIGKTVTVTFTGKGNPWKPGTGGATLTATRDDTSDTADFTVKLAIPLPGGLTAADGAEITTTTGSTSPVITITNAPIAENGTITINTSGLDPYVVGGQLRTANVMVTDTAAAANWTGSVTGNTLKLTSTGGATAKGETVTVTFTGASGAEWIADTGAERTIPLIANRTDTHKTGSFNFVIDIGGRPVADFSASPVSAMAPATVTFTDKSSRSPLKWNWSFGDGTYSELQNPSHYYSTGEVYTVALKATNSRGSNTITKADYLDIFNGGVRESDTVINGLSITNCGGPQSVTVNTAILPAALIPNNSVLEIQPPAESGFKNITMYALNGVGFSKAGNLITGSPTGVHLVSEDIAPSPGFSPGIGTHASFNWSADIPSYPCNAIISTSIRERVTPENNAKLLRIASGQVPPAVPKGTAYTATITKTNFPSSVPVKLHMSINPGWRTLLDPTSIMFIWRIADDGNSGQILPTHRRSTDPVKHLDYYEADSPLGMSTFGMSAFTGNNNPFQLVTFVIASFIAPQNPVGPVINEADQQVTPSVTATPIPNATMPLPRLPEGITAKLYTNADGVITQATTVKSADGLVTVSIGTGTVAKDQKGKPLASITLTPVPAENLPGTLPEGALMVAGRTYELQPDGAAFSPGISLIFTAPRDAQFGQDFSVKYYDRATGTWQDVPTRYDSPTGTITGQVSRFCTFALFTRTITARPSAAVTNTPSQPADIQAVSIPPTAVSTVVGLVEWIIHLLAENVIIVVVVIILIAGFLLYEWKQRREPWK
jgi:PKD repeat protein